MAASSALALVALPPTTLTPEDRGTPDVRSTAPRRRLVLLLFVQRPPYGSTFPLRRSLPGERRPGLAEPRAAPISSSQVEPLPWSRMPMRRG